MLPHKATQLLFVATKDTEAIPARQMFRERSMPVPKRGHFLATGYNPRFGFDVFSY
jgi:hypothetical protein